MVSTILGTEEHDVFSSVGMKALDNRLDNDDRVENLIFADRQTGKYKKDTDQ
jgi:hypothetical protein